MRPKPIKEIYIDQLNRVLQHRHKMKWRRRDNRRAVHSQARRIIAEIRSRS